MRLSLSCLTAALALSLAAPLSAVEPDEQHSRALPLRTAPVTNPLEIEAAGFPADTPGVFVNSRGDYARMVGPRPDDKQSASALFGVVAVSRLAVTGLEFEQVGGLTVRNTRTDFGRIYCMTTSTAHTAQIQLPAGAQILGVSLYGQDTNADLNLNMNLTPISYPVNFGGASGPAYGSQIASLTATGGYNGGYFRVDSPLLDHTFTPTNPYHLRLSFPACASDGAASGLSFLRADVLFRRQISPAPVTATFADVPVGGPFHREIEALAASGITLGCGGGNYCPNDPVTRGQMAAFLSRALGLHWGE